MSDDLATRLEAGPGSRELSDEQIDMMKHALGYGHRQPPGWRNHYATEPGCTGWEAWQDLIARGFAENRGQYPGGLHCLSVTPAGHAALVRAKQETRDDE